MIQSAIKISEGTFGYENSGKTRPILENVSLEFFAGELVGIVGLNGVGKSTLLRSICGLLPILKGKIDFAEEELSKLSLEMLSQKIAVVLTEKIAGFNLTAFDIVASGQMPYTDSFHHLKKSHRDIIENAIDLCSLGPFRNYPIDELSDGLFQKTIIAKAIAQQTPIMLLDEPTAFLDYASKHSLFILLKNLTQSEKKCVLVSSHDLDLLVKYCDKLLIISEHNIELLNVEEARKNSNFLKIGGGFL